MENSKNNLGNTKEVELEEGFEFTYETVKATRKSATANVRASHVVRGDIVKADS